MKLFWWKDKNNFGDMISPFIMSKYFNTDIHYSTESNKWLGCGSLLSWAKDRDTIWGTGCLFPDYIIKAKRLKVHAVRGPLTREILLKSNISCPQRYGDPCLLLPRWLSGSKTKHKIGIVPHWSEFSDVKNKFDNVIDLTKDFKQVINDITSCQYILSSALHGCICADAYQIPNLFVRFTTDSEKQHTDTGRSQFKFRDYGINYNPVYCNKDNFIALSKKTHYKKPRLDYGMRM